MSDPAALYRMVFLTACVMLIVEATFGIMAEMKRSDSTTITQATVWIRSLLMIILAVIMFFFLRSTTTSASSYRPL